ncbi:GNAT family N-acetyltransferase [Candidatus Zixiibacteriota bacterium]
MPIVDYVDDQKGRAELFDFYRRVYPQVLNPDNVKYLTDDDHFNWMYKGTNILLFRDDDGAIVAHCWMRYEPMMIEDREIKGAYITDIFVDPNTQQRGLGSKFVQYIKDAGDIIMGVGMTGPAEGLYRKNKITIIDEGQLFGLFVNPRRCLVGTGKMGGFSATLLHVPLKVFTWGKAIQRRISCPKKLTNLKLADHFESAWDEAWNKYLEHIPIRAIKTKEILDHKKRKGSSVIVALVDDRPLGYVTFRVARTDKFAIGKITDIVFDPTNDQKVGEYLLRSAVETLLRGGEVDGIFCIASSPELKTACKRAGLYALRRQKTMTSISQEDIDRMSSKSECVWYNTFVDADMDCYW